MISYYYLSLSVTSIPKQMMIRDQTKEFLATFFVSAFIKGKTWLETSTFCLPFAGILSVGRNLLSSKTKFIGGSHFSSNLDILNISSTWKHIIFVFEHFARFCCLLCDVPAQGPLCNLFSKSIL